ncbi:MAG: DNA polymerase III subunit delta [Candidatus Nealsonbacteria bacterium]|nr:DNA polymerase III subunit delta [Candidatus Nealsonbacteria bacterium]
MIILFYGEDTYRSRQKFNEFIGHYKKTYKNGLNLIFIDGETAKFQDLNEICSTLAMFKEKKLIAINGLFSSKELKERFIEEIEKFLKSKYLFLLYENKNILQKDSLLKVLKKNAKIQKFDLLEGLKLKNWIKKEFDRYKAIAEKGVVEKLIECLGSDTWRISNEINKLVSYKLDSEPIKISLGDLNIFLKPDIDAEIFKTIDFLGSKNKKSAIELFQRHLETGERPIYLFSMINFQFRNILEVKDAIERGYDYYKILDKIKLHPFLIKKSYYLAQKFTIDELKKIYQRLFEADLNIKTGKVNPETALYMFIASI